MSAFLIRRRSTAAYMLLAIVVGCATPYDHRFTLGEGSTGCACGQPCAFEASCGDGVPPLVHRQTLTAGFHPPSSPCCHACGFFDPPPPGRFHPVPTRPVFAGEY